MEWVKAASDINLPVSGTITAVNEGLSDTPEVVNGDPYGKGWIVKFTLSDAGELAGLLDAAAYEAYCNERG
jgi:glycine cleavage system H protein